MRTECTVCNQAVKSTVKVVEQNVNYHSAYSGSPCCQARVRYVHIPGPCVQCSDKSWVDTGMGKLCKPCVDVRDAAFRAVSLRRMNAATCDICEINTGGPDICQSCCGENGHERDPGEGMMCLNCDAEWDG